VPPPNDDRRPNRYSVGDRHCRLSANHNIQNKRNTRAVLPTTRFAGALRIRSGSAARNAWIVRRPREDRHPQSTTIGLTYRNKRFSFKPCVGAGVGDGVGANTACVERSGGGMQGKGARRSHQVDLLVQERVATISAESRAKILRGERRTYDSTHPDDAIKQY